MTRSMDVTISYRILPALLTAVCMAAPLAAAPSPEGEGAERPTPRAASAEIGVSGLRIVVDPSTGEIVSAQARESHVLSQALEHALSRSTQGLEVFEIPTGGMGVHLDGRFQHVMMVKVKADGSFDIECVDSVREAKAVLRGKEPGSDDDSRVR